MNTTTPELVQDRSTNNLHMRGTDKEDGTPTALCNRGYRVYTYRDPETQASLAREWAGNWCPRCQAKAAKAGAL